MIHLRYRKKLKDFVEGTASQFPLAPKAKPTRKLSKIRGMRTSRRMSCKRGAELFPLPIIILIKSPTDIGALPMRRLRSIASKDSAKSRTMMLILFLFEIFVYIRIYRFGHFCHCLYYMLIGKRTSFVINRVNSFIFYCCHLFPTFQS